MSPACDNCYAESYAKRTGQGHLWQGDRRRTSVANWKLPLKWNRQAYNEGIRRRVFCASLADVFDNQVPVAWRLDLWNLIWATPHLDWLLLTKRIGNARMMLPSNWPAGYGHVWLGISVVTQEEVGRDVPKLIKIPAAKRFLSMEPLLERVDLCETFGMWWNSTMQCFEATGAAINRDCFGGRAIDWVIAGGESGARARHMEPGWALRLRAQCDAAGAKFFMKQGSQDWGPNFKVLSAMPAGLRVQEFPT